MPRASLADPQLTLVPRQTSVYAPQGGEILDLLNRALRENRIPQEVLAQATGVDPSHLSRMLGGKGAHPSLDVIAAVMAMDAKRVVIHGLSARCGGSWSKVEPDPAAENRRLRAALQEERERIDRLLEGGHS
jgi:hypothetical protein